MFCCFEYWWAKSFAVSKTRICSGIPHLISSQTPQPLGHDCKTEVLYLYRWRYVFLTTVWAFTFLRCYVKTIFWELLIGWWVKLCGPKISKLSKVWTWAGWTHVISIHTPPQRLQFGLSNFIGVRHCFLSYPYSFFSISTSYLFLIVWDFLMVWCIEFWCIEYWWAKNFAVSKIQACAGRRHLVSSQTP